MKPGKTFVYKNLAHMKEVERPNNATPWSHIANYIALATHVPNAQMNGEVHEIHFNDDDNRWTLTLQKQPQT